LIPHYIESIKERWIVHQDDRTGTVRVAFLKTQVEQLKLAKEFQQTVDDLELLSYEKRKRIKILDLETTEIDSRKRTLSQTDELAALRERKKIELEIAQLDDQIGKFKSASAPSAKLSPDDEKARRHAASEARLARLNQELQKASAVHNESERKRKEHAIQDEIDREMTEWSKTL
jgi:hypothetical protein